MPDNLVKARKPKHLKETDIVTSRMDVPDVVVDPMQVQKRKGFKITDELLAVYEQRDRSLDESDAPVVSPEKWEHAMRREEMFRPCKSGVGETI